MKDFQKAMDAEKFRKEGHELIDLLADHLSACQDRKSIPISPLISPETARKNWTKELQVPTTSLELFKKILNESTVFHHPRFLGHQIAPPAPASVLAGIMAEFLNNGMAVFEMGPASSSIEKVVIDWIGNHIGYQGKFEGILTSGGSLANLTALLAARQIQADNNVWDKGYEKQSYAIMVSEEAHYCVERSVKIMGLGSEGIIKIPVNDKKQMKTELLDSMYQQALSEGKKIIAVVGSACSTSTGSYDNLEQIADFTEKNKIWFHVDGAHGGAVALSKKYDSLIQGIDRADSVVIDFHKLFLTPGLCTGLIFKNASSSYAPFAQKASYLLEAKPQEWHNIANRTLECTKTMMSIKIYTLINLYGDSFFEEYIDYIHDLARTFATKVEANSNFELALSPESNIICYRYISNEKAIDLNKINRSIREELLKDGDFYIVQTVIDDQLFLRCTLVNPLSDESDIDALLHKIETIYQNRIS